MEPKEAATDVATEPEGKSGSWYRDLINYITGLRNEIVKIIDWSIIQKKSEYSQSFISTIFLFLVFWVVIYGPTGGWRGTSALFLFIGAMALYEIAYRLLERNMQGLEDAYYLLRNPIVILQNIFILTLALIVVWNSENGGMQNESAMYVHFMILVILVLVIIPLIIARMLGRWLFAATRKKKIKLENGKEVSHSEWLKKLMQQVELAQKVKLIHTGFFGVLRSIVNSFYQHIVVVLYLPALLFLIVPNVLNESKWLIFGVGILLDILILFVATQFGKEEDVITWMKKLLFQGGQGVVSIVILILGYGRLLDIGYVTTVVEGFPKTLLLYLGSAYATFWYFEFWVNRFLSEEVLAFLKETDDPIDVASYSYFPGKKKTAGSLVRSLRIYGRNSKFSVIDRSGAATGESAIIGRYMRMELLSHLVENAATARDLPSKSDMRKFVSDMRARQRFYFNVLSILLIGISYLGYVGLSRLAQIPGQTVITSDTLSTTGGAVDLSMLLFEGDSLAQPEPVVMLAASGGGTRAALYTASVLHGLAREGLLDQVKLVSGVSGGGTALAYFAANNTVLTSSTSDSDNWRKFYEKMSWPFIKDVFENSAEIRLIGSTRLGTLLDESFQRNLGNTQIGNVGDLGVIFNTSIAGSLHREKLPGSATINFAGWVENNRHLARSDMAGNRLVFTNLRTQTAFPPIGLRPHQLRYVVVNDDSVKLSTAAAMNANFPPVFSNAIVDIVDEAEVYGTRYWITDGGAIENRGIISLLLALRDAIGNPTVDVGPKPDIHVIVAEASSVSYDYSDSDRGLGTVFSASEKFASRLMTEMLENINDIYHQEEGDGRVYLHYLEMPLALRSRGGLGTHWMLPRFVRISDPAELDIFTARKESKFVSSPTVKRIISLLHQNHDFYSDDPHIPFWERDLQNSRVEQVSYWIREDYDLSWSEMIQEIKGKRDSTLMVGE